VIIVRDQTSIAHIQSAAIRSLVQQRIQDLQAQGFDLADVGLFVVLEVGDTLDDFVSQIGFNPLCNRHTGLRYDQLGYSPSFEFVQAFPDCFELVFVLDDTGYGVELIVPIEEGIDTDLLTLCRRYALPPQVTR